MRGGREGKLGSPCGFGDVDDVLVGLKRNSSDFPKSLL